MRGLGRQPDGFKVLAAHAWPVFEVPAFAGTFPQVHKLVGSPRAVRRRAAPDIALEELDFVAILGEQLSPALYSTVGFRALRD